MRRAMEEYWHWITGSLIGEPGLFWKLIEQYGTPERLFMAKEEELLKRFPKNERAKLPGCAGGGKNGILKGG